MQPAAPEVSTCPNCGGVLEETPSGGLGCMSCLLRPGIGSEEEVAQDSTSNPFEDGGRLGADEIDRRKDGSLYELGRGAVGVTYRATDTPLQRKVALKIIKAISLSEAPTPTNALCAKRPHRQDCDTKTSPPSTNSECASRQDNIFMP